MTQNNAALLLLDRSGSMSSCRDLTRDGVNAFLAKLRGDATGRGASFELITFDSMGFDTLRKGTIEDVSDLGLKEYEPRALTPLHDAVMHSIDRLREVQAKRHMLIIVTDGLENASKKFADAAPVRAAIEAAQKEGWIVIYLAAHVDAWKQGAAIGVPPERAMNFRAEPVTQRAGGVRGFFGGRSSVNPLAIALGAAAGVGLAMYGGKALAGALGFSEKDRNESMGVDGQSQTWQDAVDQDVNSFIEPVNGIFDLPSDLAADHADLPADFDPSLGTMDASGNQPGAPDGDVLDRDDAADHAESNFDPETAPDDASYDSRSDADQDRSDRPDPPSYDTDPPRGTRSDDDGPSWSGGSSRGSDSGSGWFGGGSSSDSSSSSGSSWSDSGSSSSSDSGGGGSSD